MAITTKEDLKDLDDAAIADMIVASGGKVRKGSTREQLETAVLKLIAGESAVDTDDDFDAAEFSAEADASEAAKAAAATTPAPAVVLEQPPATPAKRTKAVAADEELVPVHFLKSYHPGPENWPTAYIGRPMQGQFDKIWKGTKISIPLSLFKEIRAKGTAGNHIIERNE